MEMTQVAQSRLSESFGIVGKIAFLHTHSLKMEMRQLDFGLTNGVLARTVASVSYGTFGIFRGSIMIILCIFRIPLTPKNLV